jgi:hypothetical protein
MFLIMQIDALTCTKNKNQKKTIEDAITCLPQGIAPA